MFLPHSPKAIYGKGTFSTVSMACVSCEWADLDNDWEQRKLEAREMFDNATRCEAAVPSVQCTLHDVLGGFAC